MEKEKIDEVVQRYLHSKNEDFVNDFNVIVKFLETNNINTGELVDEVVKHYYQLIVVNGGMVKDYCQNQEKGKILNGLETLKQWVQSIDADERKELLSMFQLIYNSANIPTKVCLLQIKKTKEAEFTKAMTLRGEKVTKEDLQKSSTKTEDIEYLNEEIGRLTNSATSIEVLVEEFEKGCSRITKEIKNDITLEKREWKPIRDKYIDKYYQLLNELQRKNEDWHSKPEKYTVYGGNEVFRKHIFNQLLKLQDNYSIDGVLDVFNEANEILKYRISVYITYWGMEDVFLKKLSIMGELMEANADLSSFLKVMQTI